MNSVRGVRVVIGDDGRPLGRDSQLVDLLSQYQGAVVRSAYVDVVTTELVRLRCARQHDCRICQTLRLADAASAGVDSAMSDQIDYYEQSALSERHKVALRLVDAFIWRPTEISDDLVRQAHDQFSDDELAELLIDITKWSTQKIHVTLGTDGADNVVVDADGVGYFSFASDGAVVRSTVVG